MREMLEEAGTGGYAALLVGVFSWLVSLAMLGLSASRKTVRPALVAAGLALGLGLAAVLAGIWAETGNVRKAMAAVAHVDPADRPAILEGARREAAQARSLGLLAGGPSMLLAVVVIGVALARFPGRSP